MPHINLIDEPWRHVQKGKDKIYHSLNSYMLHWQYFKYKQHNKQHNKQHEQLNHKQQ